MSRKTKLGNTLYEAEIEVSAPEDEGRPDLLEALEEMLATYGTLTMDEMPGVDNVRVLAMLAATEKSKAAIAKAKGETEHAS